MSRRFGNGSGRAARTARLALAAALCLAGVTASRALQEAPPPTPASGFKIDWEGWSFRWSLRPREGLVLHDVHFQKRKVLKYAGLAEIFVPYHPGQPRPEDSLDGMGGKNLAELLPGNDCLPGTTCRMLNALGRPEGRRVVGIHEESTGLLYLGERGRAYGKMLVLWCASRLGGYTYFIQWRFRTDGMIMPQVGLTGRLEHTSEDPPSPRGTVVQKLPSGSHVFAPAHVHNFYYHLDFDVDGPDNDAVEELAHRQDEPGRSLSSQDHWTGVPRESARSLDAASFRKWRVVDRSSRNALGHLRSWEIQPGGNGVFRGGAAELFTHADLWVSRYKPREHPFSSADPRPIKQALPTYLNDEPVDGHDVVAWYVMHVHHVPRTEDWPAMPVEWFGFNLAPRDFLDTSPLEPREP